MTGLQLRYPEARRSGQTDLLHGQSVADPYRWLEEPDSVDTLTWLDGQQTLCSDLLDRLPRRPEIHAELAGLLSAGFVSAPEWFGDRAFRLRLRPGQEYATLDVRQGDSERTLFDPVAWDSSGLTTMEAWQPSPDGRLVTIQLSVGGAEDSQLYVLAVDSAEIVDGPIDRVRKSSIGWLPDGERFYYVRRLAPELIPGEENYHRRVYLHRIGESPDSDELIFGAGRAATDFYSVSVWDDQLVLTAAPGSGAAREVWTATLQPGQAARPTLVPIGADQPGRTSVVGRSLHTNLLYLQTDSAAPRGRIVAVPVADPMSRWHEVVAEDPTAVLTGFVVVDGGRHAVVSRRRSGSSELELISLEDGVVRARPTLPGPGVTGRVHAGQNGQNASFTFTDPGRPPTVLELDVPTGQVVFAEPATGGGGGAGITGSLIAVSADGTEVLVFVLSPQGVPDQPRPTILTGYGGFGAVMSPSYRAEAQAWVAAGGVFAIACLRGGGENGAQWHRAGTGRNKQRVFEDFDAVTDLLVQQGWTTPAQLGIWGGSNGGLLVGAAITQHPEKYGAAICMAPLLDMVRFELSGLGPSWRREYGTVENAEDFQALLAYSPYHAVQPATDYPAIMFAVFDGDSRVDLLHARKMCAALQHASSGERPIIFRLERGAGHGARTVSSGSGLLADCLAFLFDQLAR